MRKLFLSSLIALGVGIGAAQAQVVIKVRPPRVQADHRGPRPGRDYVWIGGFNRWDGRAYAWVPGRWERRPNPRAVWVAPRYVHRRDGYVFYDGHWR